MLCLRLWQQSVVTRLCSVAAKTTRVPSIRATAPPIRTTGAVLSSASLNQSKFQSARGWKCQKCKLCLSHSSSSECGGVRISETKAASRNREVIQLDDGATICFHAWDNRRALVGCGNAAATGVPPPCAAARQLRKMVESRSLMGMFELKDTTFGGGCTTLKHDKILVSMGKYILEELPAETLESGRLSNEQSPMIGEEFVAFRSAINKCNWIGREVRSHACAAAGMLATRILKATSPLQRGRS